MKLSFSIKHSGNWPASDSQLDPVQNIPDYKVSNVKSKQKLSSAIIYLTPAVQLAYTSPTRNARNYLSLLK